MEKIDRIVCSECGKPVNPESARIFQKEWYLDGLRPEAERIEVNWEKRTAQKGVGSKPKLNRFLFCICISLLFSGCAPQYSSVMEQYRNAPICCESVSAFIFESLQIGDKIGFYVNENSPAYMFETGKSYFKAFVLPQSSYPYRVSVGSCELVDIDGTNYVFFPLVLTLNEDYEVVRSTTSADFRLREVLLTEIDHIESILEPYCSGNIVAGEISFDEEDETEKYLIIFTSNDLLKAKSSYSIWIQTDVMIDGYWVPSGSGWTEKVVVLHSPTGLIMLSVQPGLF